MKTLNSYIINYSSLKNGNHTFDFHIDNEFFTFFENSEIKIGEIDVAVNMLKANDFLQLGFSIKGIVNTICDRCLENFDMQIEGNYELIVKFGETFEEVDEETIIIPRNEYELNVSQYIYEFIHLCLPLAKTHEEYSIDGSKCNEEMVKKLEEYMIRNVEEDKLENKNTDPRWDILKNIHLT